MLSFCPLRSISTPTTAFVTGSWMSAVTGDEYQQSIWLLRATTPFFRKRHKAPSLMDEPTRFVRMEEAPGSSGCDTESGGRL